MVKSDLLEQFSDIIGIKQSPEENKSGKVFLFRWNIWVLLTVEMLPTHWANTWCASGWFLVAKSLQTFLKNTVVLHNKGKASPFLAMRVEVWEKKVNQYNFLCSDEE